MTIPGRPEVRQLRTSLTRTVPRSLGPQNYQLFSSIRLSLAQSAAVSLNLGYYLTLSGGLRLRFAIATDPDPSAPPVPDLTRVIRARAHVQSVTIDSAVVRLDEQEVAGEEEFDLGDQSDVDELVGRIRQGTATVTLVNDFPVRVSGTIMLGDTTKQVEVVPRGTTEVAISYTRAELQQLLSGPVSYAWNATVTTDGEQTVDSGMQITVSVRLDITLRTEPEE